MENPDVYFGLWLLDHKRSSVSWMHRACDMSPILWSCLSVNISRPSEQTSLTRCWMSNVQLTSPCGLFQQRTVNNRLGSHNSSKKKKQKTQSVQKCAKLVWESKWSLPKSKNWKALKQLNCTDNPGEKKMNHILTTDARKHIG